MLPRSHNNAFVCGVGTGGTPTGVGLHPREAHPDVHIGVVVPQMFPEAPRTSR